MRPGDLPDYGCAFTDLGPRCQSLNPWVEIGRRCAQLIDRPIEMVPGSYPWRLTEREEQRIRGVLGLPPCFTVRLDGPHRLTIGVPPC